MSGFDWILRGERAKTRKPKGQYLYDELKDRDTGIINGRESAEYKWRKQNESKGNTGYDPDESQIDFQGPTYDQISNQ